MSNFNPNAPAFIPTFLRHTSTNEGINIEEKPIVQTQQKTSLVFIIFGCRGAGKTTQSELLAKEYNLLHISSGDIYRDGKQPFVELRKILKEEFGENNNKEEKYNGIVLDRFVANSEFDAFYVQSALNSVNLPVPFVFMLSINSELAAKRADARGDNKTGHQHWRIIEQKAQAVTANTIYAPIGCLKKIEIKEEDTIEDIFKEIKSTIESKNLPTNVMLSSEAKHEKKGMKLIEDYETYMELTEDVHKAVKNFYGRRDSAPLSSIGAYLDKDYFSFSHKSLRSLLSTLYVTLKADGERFLLVKHKRYGYIGFPSAFTHCYDLNFLFKGIEMNSEFTSETKKSFTGKNLEMAVDFLLDTEMVVHNNEPIFYILDYVYFWGLEGKKIRFELRLKLLREYFEKLLNAKHVIILKDYVPINKLKTLLPKWKEADLPIDGLVFQHSEVYRIGRDKFLIKWKPIEQCTADFRLSNGIEKKGNWSFKLMVTDDVTESKGFGEILYENAFVNISSKIIKDNLLCNGMIVELALVSTKETEEGTITEWSFRGVRNDKPAPNKYSIVKKIVELKHINLDELADLCEKVPFYGTL